MGKKKCVISPFTFVLILCVILGCILIVVPIYSFKTKDYLDVKIPQSLQFVIPQLDSFDTIMFETSQSSGTGVYVFKKDYKNKIRAGSSNTFQSRIIETQMRKGDAVVIDFYYMKGSKLELLAKGDENCTIKGKLMDFSDYKDYSPSGSVITLSTSKNSRDLSSVRDTGNNTFEFNHNYTDFGMKYAVIENKGGKCDLSVHFSCTTPLYELHKGDTVDYCVDKSSCKLQKLPRDFFAVANVHVQTGEKPNSVTISEQYHDGVRWAFPTAIYVSLFLIVVVTGIIQLICNRRKKSPTSYAGIEDPMEQGRGGIN